MDHFRFISLLSLSMLVWCYVAGSIPLAVNLSEVTINSKGLVYSVILLLASVILTVLCLHLNSWKLDCRLGFCLILLYTIFFLCSVFFERL